MKNFKNFPICKFKNAPKPFVVVLVGLTFTLTFRHCCENVKVTLPQKPRTNSVKIMPKVCRLCLVRLQRGSKYFNVNAVESYSGFMPYRDQLTTCIPEMALDLIPNPVICNMCRQALRLAYDFKTKCLEVEEKIRKHVESQPSGEEYNLSALANLDHGKRYNHLKQPPQPQPELEIQHKKLTDDVIQEVVLVKNESIPTKLESPHHKSPIGSYEPEDTKTEHKRLYCCMANGCNEQFVNPTLMAAHRAEQHGHFGEDYVCNFCGGTFRSLQLLRRHNTKCCKDSRPEEVKAILTKRPHLPTKAKNHLKKWLFKHTDVENWFINARRRILQDLTRLKARRSTLVQSKHAEFLAMHTDVDLEEEMPIFADDANGLDVRVVEVKEESDTNG
ncbi:uncharacterized protein LOC109604079 isoform X2 [Aethina tumida]|uniref:uncharacterized protein LOC109604079 isoform X2 n=1 Tax=Aethina tumida TaxID=116153 RepID=UPI0021477228|nr:uncharacterized protein LOC109604079 isoform X2 [Aethina tumida]